MTGSVQQVTRCCKHLVVEDGVREMAGVSAFLRAAHRHCHFQQPLDALVGRVGGRAVAVGTDALGIGHQHGEVVVRAHHAASDLRVGVGRGAKASGIATPLRLASFARDSRRHFGTELAMFHPDTVEIGKSSAAATATVPSRLSMKSLTVCMAPQLRNP